MTAASGGAGGSDAPKRGRLTGVGVGPGDPGLLTRRAVAVLESADRVVVPVADDGAVGRAEGVVREALPELEVTRLVFAMTVGEPGEAARTASHNAAARQLAPFLAAGEHVAFATLGDPNVYSTFPSLVAALGRLGVRPEVDTVPGITAFQDLAARSGTVLLDGTESLLLVTALDGPEPVADALMDGSRAVVVYKGGRHMPAIAELVASHGRLGSAVVGERLGLPDERVGPLAALGHDPASYLVTVIVPPVATGRPVGGAP